MSKGQSESQIHAAVADYLTLALPHDAWWTTFPSGGGGVVRGAQLKQRGLKAGVPDILIIFRSEAFFIELKAEKGRLSEAQHDCWDDLSNAGARTCLCRSIDDVSRALNAWGITKRKAA